MHENKMASNNKLKVTVINGRGLKCNDAKKAVTPYCLLQLGKTSYETKYISDDCNPEWNEEFIFDVSPGCEVLSFSIWHKNTLQNDVVIGYAFVDFGNCKQNEKTSINIQLMGIYSGEINLLIHPMYETTSSKVERLEHKIMLLTYEMSRCTGKMEQLRKRLTEVTEENYKLTRSNKMLEKEIRILLEYEILSTSATPSPRRKINNVFEYDKEKCQTGTRDIKPNRYSEDEFDIISERDLTFSTSIIDDKNNVGLDHTVTNGHSLSDIDKNKMSLNDWERHLTQSIEALEDELERLNNNNERRDIGRKVDEENKMSLSLNDYNSLITKVTDLEVENNELKILLQQMKVNNDEDLNVLVQHLRDEGEQTYESIRNQISQISNGHIESDEKLELLKEIICDLDLGIHKLNGESEGILKRKSSIRASVTTDLENDEEFNKLSYFDKTLNDENEDQVVAKNADEPDVIREYFWDEYLPISTKHSKDGDEDVDSNVDVINGDITEDIDDFIRSTYVFHNENTLILRSDPELYTKSDIEEENEHFKDMNIRLIKENEELDSCLQLLQVQVKNLKKIQSILFDQLVKRAPVYMKQILEKITDASQILNEDQITLYRTHFGAVLDEMINLNDGQLYAGATGSEDYNFAVSLLYHQLSSS